MTIKIQVAYPSAKAGEYREVYRNQISVSGTVFFEFTKLLDGLNLLYQNPNKVITFTIV